ncbi:MAG: hypothetical protein AAB835_01535, partial [Patescibacteria group bacterium]
MRKNIKHGAYICVAVLAIVYTLGFSPLASSEYRSGITERFIPLPELDKADYNARVLALAHIATTTETSSTATTSSRVTSTTTPSVWPVSTIYPNANAILPFKRIVAYYGNFYSKGMGVLGEYPTEQMLVMLASTTEMWTVADPDTPAVPAIHYIAVVAQASAGKEGKYILRMPDDQIDRALGRDAGADDVRTRGVRDLGIAALDHHLEARPGEAPADLGRRERVRGVVVVAAEGV